MIKFAKITGIAVAAIFLLLFLAPYLFPDAVSGGIKKWTNNSIQGELNFSKARLSFFTHFPSLTLTLYHFSLKGSTPFQQDTLVYADAISLGINLKDLLFNKEVNINKIFISHALINVKVDEKGQANYNIYVSKSNSPAGTSTDSSGASLKLERIEIDHSHLVFNDRSVPMAIEASGFQYLGAGDLSKSIFDLKSRIRIDSLNFSLKDASYLIKKKFEAELITRINTHSLSILLEKNDLTINRLLLQFKGSLDFLKNGYRFDINLSAPKSDLHDFITALPPQYLAWLEKTSVKGTVDLQASFKGPFIVSENKMPSASCSIRVRNGFVRYQDAPFPAYNLFMNLDLQLPSLDPDSLKIQVDSFFFNVDKDYLKASIRTTGLAQPYVSARVNARMDLEKLDNALGIGGISMKGQFSTNLEAEGKFAMGPGPVRLRKRDTVILSIPRFNLESTLKGGYIKFSSRPEAVSQLQLRIHASCPDRDFKKIMIQVDSLNATALGDFVHGSAKLGNIRDFPVEANLQSSIDLADIKKFLPLDSIDLAGVLKLNIRATGRYQPEKKQFPQIKADLSLLDGRIQTAYYPHPVEKIQIMAKASDVNGTLNGLNVFVEPVSFVFEGNPFTLRASLSHFDDLLYDVQARGILDLGKIYQVFSRHGLGLTGYAKTNFSLKGQQSDAVNGHLDRLRNEGTIELRNLSVTEEYFPSPFIIREGLFSFKDEKMWFDKFLANYGHSDIRMDGFLSNTVNYFLNGKEKLKGNFNLNANLIDLNEFTVFASKDSNENKHNPGQLGTAGRDSGSGVLMIPSNLDLTIKANAKNIRFNGLNLQEFTGGLQISNGQLQLTETGFNLIGCSVKMDGLYGYTSPSRGFFEYRVQATDFDIKRAYNEIKLFHDLASAAGKAEGVISLDYSLKGKLNNDMYPVYPSLTGGGTLSIKKVKMKGLKLFKAVSSKTEKQEISDPDLSKIDFKTTIKNNIITLERVKFKTSGFRVRMEGQTSFDGKLNIKMRLGLPPLGIIGIPMSITGSSENPQVKLGKNDQEALSETEDQH
jgi:AsmA protein